MGFADTSELYRLAIRLDDNASQVRARARQLTAATEALPWQSPGAQLFRAQSVALAGQLLRSAGGLDHTAEQMRQHAHTVRQRQDFLLAGERAAARLALDIAGVLW